MAIGRDTTAPTHYRRGVGYDKRQSGGLSYGNGPVVMSKLGVSHAMPAAQTASGARNAALSFGRAGSNIRTSAPLSHRKKVGGFSLGSFLSTMSMGNSPSRPARRASQRSGGGLSAQGTSGSVIPPNPQVVATGNVDGGAHGLGNLRALTGAVLNAIGSGGDGAGGGAQVHNAAATTSREQSGGMNPLWIAGAAVAVGAIYFATKK